MVLNLVLWSFSSPTERKFSVSVTVNHVTGIEFSDSGASAGLLVDVKWKGTRGVLGTRFRKSFKRDQTALHPVVGNTTSWFDSFSNECVLFPVTKNGSNTFQPWDVNFVLNKVDVNDSSSSFVIASASADISQFNLSHCGEHEFEEELYLNCISGISASNPTLSVTFRVKEIECVFDSALVSKPKLKTVSSCESIPELELSDIESSVGSGHSAELCSELCLENNDVSKTLSKKKKKTAASTHTAKEPSHEKSMISLLSFKKSLSWNKHSKSQTSSLEDPISPKTSDTCSVRSLNYETEEDDNSLDEFMHYRSITAVNLSANGTLPVFPTIDSSFHITPASDINRHADFAQTFPSPPRHKNTNGNGLLSLCPGSSSSLDDSWDDFSNFDNSSHSASMSASNQEAVESQSTEPLESSSAAASTTSFLPWRKRKHGVKSPKASLLREPLLNKFYGDNGGDEIDFDRRETLLAESLGCSFCANSLFSNESEGFFVGRWERQHVKCREGTTTLHTDVFFASFDQRHESVGGEGACAVLVAMIAEWMHGNNNATPTKTEFDDIIREGSVEWRRLCELDSNKVKYVDKHLPLEAVFEGSLRKISLVSDKSFVGFFKPEAMETAEKKEEGKDECMSANSHTVDQYLEGLMTFDRMWEEVEASGEGIYIVSWNDHFFVLVVRSDACFLIDTLGERLMEGCSDAFILRFDSTTYFERFRMNEVAEKEKVDSVTNLASEATASAQEGCSSAETVENESNQTATASENFTAMEKIEALSPMKMCGLFVKEFLASVPLQYVDKFLKDGLDIESVFKKLQVELHATELIQL